MKGADVDEGILGLFREGEGFVSGEELSRHLGVSRTAVWKHMKGLRAQGYHIEAVPAKGYRLVAAPDRLTPRQIMAGLPARRIGGSVICLKETESTNAVAFKLAEEGGVEGTVVIADAQSAGKGRLGRVWLSPPGVNLYCSVILRPPISPVAACQLTFLSVVAVARAVEACTTVTPQIKWPNDILVSGKKVAGLLNEMNAETEKVNFVVLGIGVNLNMRADQFGTTLRHPATSLFEAGGVEVNRVQFARTLLAELDRLYEVFLKEGEAPIRSEWLERSRICGRGVKVSCGEREFSGVVEGLDAFGALLVRLSDGKLETVLSGDVSLIN
ncbi:biotin--[acetyl-CoA-carboxylase] ligase [Geomesophilobacter sediminis]|uniref:Bifunctional ligase/repressor BirA n=1 Tax=Geomesophilobacter sediminis TaxID=2798584 RepID=A0A8J7M2I3_9BACT|nr:biotin--[acetyl-CoA-carboxylase] ligase [Geomesophilobacter sediminis]MBJ6727553.1 biotin--[acetyl-CoA-carboxylase] ligase [Geomesophilobacter sediminis]